MFQYGSWRSIRVNHTRRFHFPPFAPRDRVRHDGWTGEKMAKLGEALADSGLVGDACLAAGKSSDRQFRKRSCVRA